VEAKEMKEGKEVKEGKELKESKEVKGCNEEGDHEGGGLSRQARELSAWL
jgi:hypothetical protein